jgi:stage V sporulation protein B
MALVVYVFYNILSYILGFVLKGYFNNAISVLIAIGLGVLSYLYIMVLSKGITNDEVNIILSKIKRFVPNKVIYLCKIIVN